jgi:hypothetical protein
VGGGDRKEEALKSETDQRGARGFTVRRNTIGSHRDSGAECDDFLYPPIGAEGSGMELS